MKLNISNKQKIFVFSLLAIICVIMIGLFFYNSNKQVINKNEIINAPVFLDSSEKIKLNIQPELRIQVIKRNADGKILLYKVIQKDSDIVTNFD